MTNATESTRTRVTRRSTVADEEGLVYAGLHIIHGRLPWIMRATLFFSGKCRLKKHQNETSNRYPRIPLYIVMKSIQIYIFGISNICVNNRILNTLKVLFLCIKNISMTNVFVFYYFKFLFIKLYFTMVQRIYKKLSSHN